MGFGLMIRFIGLFDTEPVTALQITVTHRLAFSIMVTVLHGSGFQWQIFPFLWVPELFPASATNFLQQQLTRTDCSSQFVPLITSWHEPYRKHHSSLLYFSCCHGTCLYVKSLLSDSCYIAGAFTVNA
jgi:hypothetical protein